MAAFDPTSPFRRADALAAGLTVGQLRGPGYRQLLRGVHVSSEVEVDVRVRARAALLVAPEGAAIARHTACELWDGWPPPDWRTHIVLPSGHDSRSARMVGQAVDARASRSADGITTLAGIRVTDRVLPDRVFTRIVPELLNGSRTPAGVPVWAQLLGSDVACLADNAALLPVFTGVFATQGCMLVKAGLEARGFGPAVLRGPLLLPFTRQAVPEIDLAARRLVIDPPVEHVWEAA